MGDAVRGIERARLHADLTILATLATALARGGPLRPERLQLGTMSSGWTVEVQRLCPDCGGKGDPPSTVETAGRTRTTTIGGTCQTCHGKRVQTERVGLQELRELLDAT